MIFQKIVFKEGAPHMMSEKISRSFGTHDGTFHADEVTACALLLLFDLIDADKVVRSREPSKLVQCEYVCDVGGFYSPEKKLFDHHQAEYTGLLSSAGMVLLYLKDRKIISDKEFDILNNTVVRGVDDHDNGRAVQESGYCSFSHVVANFNPIVYEVDDKTQNTAFFEALNFVLGHFKRIWERHKYVLKCKETVAQTMKEGKLCLHFDRAIPWLESFFELDGEYHPALFVIMPAGEHWKLRGIPPNYENRMKVRLPLPHEWAGLLDNELKEVSGIKGAIFCHKGRFTSVWETKADALKALEFVLKKAGIKGYANNL